MKVQLKNGNLTLNEISRICGGRLISSFDAGELFVGSICTDSREADENTLFVAIKAYFELYNISAILASMNYVCKTGYPKRNDQEEYYERKSGYEKAGAGTGN